MSSRRHHRGTDRSPVRGHDAACAGRATGNCAPHAETTVMACRFGRLIAAGLLSMFFTAVLADAAGRLDTYLSELDTVSSQFEQHLFDEQHNLLEQARGTVLIDRPGRFRFEYTEPPQLIVGDGARVWIYDPELAQVTVRDIDAALGSTPAVLLTTDRPVGETFRVEARDTGGGFDVFRPGAEGRGCSVHPHRARVRRRGVAPYGTGRSVRPDYADEVSRYPAPTGDPGRCLHVHAPRRRSTSSMRTTESAMPVRWPPLDRRREEQFQQYSRLDETEAGDRGWIFCPEYTGHRPLKISPDDWDTQVFLFGPGLLPDADFGLEESPSEPTDQQAAVQSTKRREQPTGGPNLRRTDDSNKSVDIPDALTAEAEGAKPAVCLGTDILTNIEVNWPLSVRGNPYLLIAGLPGMGKTTCLVNLCKQLVAVNIRPIVFSYHQDIDERLEESLGAVRLIGFDGFGVQPVAGNRPGVADGTSGCRGRHARHLHRHLSGTRRHSGGSSSQIN